MKIKQKKVRITITLDRNLANIIDEKTNNRSKYMEYVLEYYFTSLGIDVSKIKL